MTREIPGRIIYLAARYDRRLELLAHAGELERLGHKVTSRWVLGLHEGAVDPDVLARCAREDLEDIDDSEVFITFTEHPDVGHTSGGRHVELGYALAEDLSIVVVGPIENVFHHLARVKVVATWAEALEYIS